MSSSPQAGLLLLPLPRCPPTANALPPSAAAHLPASRAISAAAAVGTTNACPGAVARGIRRGQATTAERGPLTHGAPAQEELIGLLDCCRPLRIVQRQRGDGRRSEEEPIALSL